MQAIILSRRDFREYDQIISAYTKERGKIEALARGVKKITSKNAAHLEPFCLVVIDVAKGKELDHVTKALPVHSFAAIRSDWHKSMAAGFVVSFVDMITRTGQPDRRVWQLLEHWLRHVERAKVMDVLMIDRFVIQLFDCLGMRPILDRCVISGVSFRELAHEEVAGAMKEKAGLYFAGGGLVSPTVRLEKSSTGEEVMPCGLKEISTMQLLLKQTPDTAEIDIPQKEKMAVHRLVLAYARYHSERPIGDWWTFFK